MEWNQKFTGDLWPQAQANGSSICAGAVNGPVSSVVTPECRAYGDSKHLQGPAGTRTLEWPQRVRRCTVSRGLHLTFTFEEIYAETILTVYISRYNYSYIVIFLFRYSTYFWMLIKWNTNKMDYFLLLSLVCFVVDLRCK